MNPTDPNFTKKFEKSSKTRVPRPKNEQIQNGRQFEWKLNIFTLLAYLYIFFLLVVTLGMFMMPRKPFLKVSWNFVFSFSRNQPFCEISDMRALFNISRKFCTYRLFEVYDSYRQHHHIFKLIIKLLCTLTHSLQFCLIYSRLHMYRTKWRTKN